MDALERLEGRERPLTTRELCKLLGRDRRTIHRYRDLCKITRDVREGGRYFFSVKEVRRFLLEEWSAAEPETSEATS